MEIIVLSFDQPDVIDTCIFKWKAEVILQVRIELINKLFSYYWIHDSISYSVDLMLNVSPISLLQIHALISSKYSTIHYTCKSKLFWQNLHFLYSSDFTLTYILIV